MGAEAEDMSQKGDIVNLERIKKLKNKELRVLVESFYDMQKLRIALGNRIRQYGKAGLLESVDPYPALERIREGEKELEGQIPSVVKQHPLWDMWFSGVKGIGPDMAAGVIAWRDDIGKADTISAFWKYHGLSPTQTKREKGQKLDHNPKAKTHVWKVGVQLLKAQGIYAEIYYRAKARYERRDDIRKKHEHIVGYKKKNGKYVMKNGEKVPKYEAEGGMKSYKLHIHNMAMRKMIKQFLADTWVMWRTVEGLPVSEPYIFSLAAQEKGIAHEHYELPKNDKQVKAEEKERLKELLRK